MNAQVIQGLQRWRTIRSTLSGSIGFVPTMGALHEGHLALLKRSVSENDATVLSIFVNTTQFNDRADLDRYPRSLEQDIAYAQRCGVDFILLPDHAELYPDDYRYRVAEGELSLALCGADRPGHFDGVLTVVMKLINLVRPSTAYFGLKDYQQYRLIKGMCESFFMETAIVGCETVREQDGLAMSSRNRRLDADARAKAGRLSGLLREARTDEAAKAALTAADMRVGYVQTLEGRRCAAVTLESCDGAVRLIDNVIVDSVDTSEMPGGESR